MAEKLKSINKKMTRKQARTEIYEKVSGVLANYKIRSESGKFDRTLKKASKLFAPFILKHSNKKAVK